MEKGAKCEIGVFDLLGSSNSSTTWKVKQGRRKEFAMHSINRKLTF